METIVVKNGSLVDKTVDQFRPSASFEGRESEKTIPDEEANAFGPLVSATPLPTDDVHQDLSFAITADSNKTLYLTEKELMPCGDLVECDKEAASMNITSTSINPVFSANTCSSGFDSDNILQPEISNNSFINKTVSEEEYHNMFRNDTDSNNHFSDFSSFHRKSKHKSKPASFVNSKAKTAAKSGSFKGPSQNNEEQQSLLQNYGSDSDESATDLPVQEFLIQRDSGSTDLEHDVPGSSVIGKTGFHCHIPRKMVADRLARLQLIAVCVLCLLFMIGESVGGFLARSLALFTDVVHLASDLISFLISLLAIYLSNKSATKNLSFGYHRAEVVGALTSVLIIWMVTGVLLYMAVERIIHEHYKKVRADEMLITASIGVVFNVIMGAVLHLEICCKSIGLKHHGHSHSNGNPPISALNDGSSIQYQSMNEIDDSEKQLQEDQPCKRKNINVRAAFIHVLGDLIQSIGVFVAAVIIKFVPDERYRLADPICTFLFCILVLCTTIPILKDALVVIMEGAPKDVSYDEMRKKLLSVPSVKLLHSLKIWSLTMDRNALAVHLCIDPISDQQKVLRSVTEMLQSSEYKIVYTAIQVEEMYSSDSKIPCIECDGPIK